MADEVGAGQIIAVIRPVGQAHRAVHLEQGRRIALLDLGHERGLVVAGGGGHDGDRHAGQLGVELGHVLPLRILLGLEVEVVDGALGGRRHGQREAQGQGQNQSNDFLHG